MSDPRNDVTKTEMIGPPRRPFQFGMPKPSQQPKKKKKPGGFSIEINSENSDNIGMV